MAPLATGRDLLQSARRVYAMTGSAARRARLRFGKDQRRMLAELKIRELLCVARAAHRGNFVRRSDPVRSRRAGCRPMLCALAVTDLAAGRFGAVLVRIPIGNLLVVARRAQVGNFLCSRGCGKQERHQYPPHALRTSLRLIDARLGCPASAMLSFNSADRRDKTRSTPA